MAAAKIIALERASKVVAGIGLGCQQVLADSAELGNQARRQNGQAHDLDQADVLLLDVVQRLVRMVQAQRMLRRGEVIAQDEVKLKRIFPAAGDGRDGVVRNAVRFGEDHGSFVRIAAPRGKDFIRQCTQPVRV